MIKKTVYQVEDGIVLAFVSKDYTRDFRQLHYNVRSADTRSYMRLPKYKIDVWQEQTRDWEDIFRDEIVHTVVVHAKRLEWVREFVGGLWRIWNPDDGSGKSMTITRIA